MIDPSNKILVNSSGSVAGLSFLLKLQNTDKVTPSKVDFSNGYTNMVNDLKDGTTAMIFDGPWEVTNIQTGSAFTGNTSNLGIAAIPRGPSGDQPRSLVGGQSYLIYAGTAHPAEAYKFISFISSTASQIAIAKKVFSPPPGEVDHRFLRYSASRRRPLCWLRRKKVRVRWGAAGPRP